MNKRILGAAIGECVHIAGLCSFLDMADSQGYETIFLGPAVSIDRLIERIKTEKPGVVALSYRLTEQNCNLLLKQLKAELTREGLLGRRYIFGGTLPTARAARDSGLFEAVYDGSEPVHEIHTLLSGSGKPQTTATHYPDLLVDRITGLYPTPLFRHHIGKSTVERTAREIELIAESGVLDVISIAPDQTAQQSFFRANDRKSGSSGAGGVPVRTEADLVRLYNASRCGNFPLVRCYSGTADLLEWAKMLVRSINNAWAAVPLFWYNELDGRGPRRLVEGITESQAVMRWHAERGIPVECNDAHQWSMRYASDAMAIAVAYLAACNAKHQGINHYILQLMLQTPPQVSFMGDLAKMIASIELVESLHDLNFQSYREVRPGIISFPADPHDAKGHLAIATMTGMLLKPHIFHVVAYCEGQYAAGASEIIESVKIVRHIFNQNKSCIDPETVFSNPDFIERKNSLKREAMVLIESIETIGKAFDDPLTRPEVLESAVKLGVLDTPQFKNRPPARGEIATNMFGGNYYSINPQTGAKIKERERVNLILLEANRE